MLDTPHHGMIFKPNKDLGLEVFVDADFAGNWKNAGEDQPENCMSRTGFLIRYQGCNIYWKSQLQTEITLSTAESEYVALSQSLRSAIPVLNTLVNLHKVFPQIANALRRILRTGQGSCASPPIWVAVLDPVLWSIKNT